MGPLEAYAALLAELGRQEHAQAVARARAEFQSRTGAFGPEDPWFEARSGAFWDDAVTSGGLGRLATKGPAAAQAPNFARGHRGLFVVGKDDEDGLVLSCLITHVELMIDEMEPGTRDAVDAAAAPFDGRVVASGSPMRVALLPGAVFHPEDAAEPIDRVLQAATARGLTTGQTLDALLKMELSLRSLSRVKASYAYRLEALRA
jgi:hypothetical protein